jgi:hypothetical protein
MNKKENHNNDPLKQYIGCSKVTKAPDDFTTGVMLRIQKEAVLSEKRKFSLIPFISIAGALTLILIAFIMPGDRTQLLPLPSIDMFRNIDFSLFDFDLPTININIPTTVVYLVLSILLLSFFDRALLKYFHREK